MSATQRVKAFVKGVAIGAAVTAIAVACAVAFIPSAAAGGIVFFAGAAMSAIAGVFNAIGSHDITPKAQGGPPAVGPEGYGARKVGASSAEVVPGAPARAVSGPDRTPPRERDEERDLVGAER